MNFVTLVSISNQTVVIIPRYSGQVLRLGSVEVVTVAEQPARVYGTGVVEVSEGYWDLCTVVAGDYDGPAFTAGERVRVDGSLMVTDWDGADNASTVTATMVPETVSATIERSIDGGRTWEPVLVETPITGLDLVNFSDWESLSNGETMYRVTAITAAGAVSVTPITGTADSGAVWLSGGVGYSDTARLLHSPKISITAKRERSLHYYKGRTLPVAYAGEGAGRSVNVAGMIPEDSPDVAQVNHLADLIMSAEPLFVFRDPDGRRIYGSPSGVTLPRRQHQLWDYEFSLEEADRG